MKQQYAHITVTAVFAYVLGQMVQEGADPEKERVAISQVRTTAPGEE
jgi:hypothetical protein